MARVAFVCALVLGATLRLPSAVAAQAPGEAVTVVDPLDIPPEHDPLARAWELPGQRGGLYLRASTSIGVHNARLGPPSWDSDAGLNANGFGSGYGVDLGGFVRPWLALHVDSSLGVMWNGDLDSDYTDLGSASVRVLAYGVAPAVTFFTPHDFYFKPAFGVGWATVKRAGESNTTDPGFYMHLVAGKDLFVDRHFSVGLQFEIVYMLLNGKDGGDVATAPGYVFSEDVRDRQFLFGVSFGFDSR